jgi:hypothetical protein
LTRQSIIRNKFLPLMDARIRPARNDGAWIAAMRLKSAIWVGAYLRRVFGAGAFAAVRRRGAEEAGAIFIKINRLDGSAELFCPAPQTVFDEARPTERMFTAGLKAQPAPDAEVEARIARELKFDPDVWVVEVEDRDGRHFLDDLVV